MNFKKKITISQNIVTSTTGQAPLSEPVEYYLDMEGLNFEAAQEHIQANRPAYHWLDEELVSQLGDPENIEASTIAEIGMQVAQHQIAQLHSDLPAQLGFGSAEVQTLEGIEGRKIPCFGMTLIEVLLR